MEVQTLVIGTSTGGRAPASCNVSSGYSQMMSSRADSQLLCKRSADPRPDGGGQAEKSGAK